MLNEGYLSPYNPPVLVGIIANNGIETALFAGAVEAERKIADVESSMADGSLLRSRVCIFIFLRNGI